MTKTTDESGHDGGWWAHPSMQRERPPFYAEVERRLPAMSASKEARMVNQNGGCISAPKEKGK
jgi:hypothetical protein